MGTIAMAAKVTHVPSIWLSEKSEKHKGVRQNAIDGLAELGRRARSRGVETFVVFDCHWIVNQGFHTNAKPRHEGRFTSHELPHFLYDLDYAHDGDPALARAIVEATRARGLKAIAHETPGMSIEYATLIPMRHMNLGGFARVVPCAVNQFASIEESRRFGEAVAAAVAASDRKVAILASGSLSHQFWENDKSEAGIDTINREFNRQVDLRVLELWQKGEIATFLDMLPDYAARCHGEVGMGDTAMLFGALGWKDYRGRGDIVGRYFPSSGTGQVNCEFSLPA